MSKMTQQAHLDPELFSVFLKSGVYNEYAQQYMRPEQIDHVDITALPGFFNL